MFNIILMIGFLFRVKLRITDMIGTHCFLAILSFVERLFLVEVKSVLGKSPFGTVKLVLCSEAIFIVFLIRSVLYRRFHCSFLNYHRQNESASRVGRKHNFFTLVATPVIISLKEDQS